MPQRRSRHEMRGLSRVDREAVDLARRALRSAGGSGAAGADREEAAYQRSARRCRDSSPYRAEPYSLASTSRAKPRLTFAKDARSVSGVTIRRPVPYGSSTSSGSSRLDAASSAIDPRLVIGEGSVSGEVSKTDTPTKYSHVRGGALDRAGSKLPLVFATLDGGSSIGSDSGGQKKGNSTTKKNGVFVTPGPSAYFKDGYPGQTLNGGSFCSAPGESCLDRVIKRSQSVPGPKYNLQGKTRDGRGHSHGRKFSSSAVRSATFGCNGNNDPGPARYDLTRNAKPKGYVKFGGKAGDRFREVGPQRLEAEEASWRPVEYYTPLGREYGIDSDKGGHCWDVAELSSSISANNATEGHVGPGSYRSVPLARHKPFSATFVRPNAKRNSSRRPLHMGIFARLTASASAKAKKIEAADRAIERMIARQTMKEERTKRHFNFVKI